MTTLIEHPLFMLVVSLAALLLAALFGVVAQKAWSPVKTGEQNEFNIVQSASLTLLGLIVGFSFSMAISRYDQRKNLEEAEANAIGTEYLRVDLLPGSGASAAAQNLLKRYLDQRILFYQTKDRARLDEIGAQTARIGADLWGAVRSAAANDRTAISALVASGMNDVLNSADYTEAAWLNRIPATAWWLMIVIGVGCNMTLGLRIETAEVVPPAHPAGDRVDIPFPDRRHRQPAQRSGQCRAVQSRTPRGVAKRAIGQTAPPARAVQEYLQAARVSAPRSPSDNRRACNRRPDDGRRGRRRPGRPRRSPSGSRRACRR